jgi:hypothetical protein
MGQGRGRGYLVREEGFVMIDLIFVCGRDLRSEMGVLSGRIYSQGFPHFISYLPPLLEERLMFSFGVSSVWRNLAIGHLYRLSEEMHTLGGVFGYFGLAGCSMASNVKHWEAPQFDDVDLAMWWK